MSVAEVILASLALIGCGTVAILIRRRIRKRGKRHFIAYDRDRE